ncbi:MAG: chloride channel protein [Clostridium sp.]|nr:chloride channel protein [Clostridium sp.]
MKTKPNWLNKLFFPGATVLYPLLALVCLFIYFFFFGTGQEYGISDIKPVDFVGWYIPAILAFILCALWGIIKKWWGTRLFSIGTIILIFSFLSLQRSLYHRPSDSVIIAVFAILVSLVCIVKIVRNNTTGRILWALPLLVFCVYYLLRNPLWTLSACTVSLLVLTILDAAKKPKLLKPVVAAVVLLFYSLTTFTYFPINPLLYLKDTKTISSSFHPRITSVVVEKDNKFMVVDGYPLTGGSPLNTQFDCWKDIPPYTCSFVGIMTATAYDSSPRLLPDILHSMFPIIQTDSCTYFTSDILVYQVLEDSLKSQNESVRLTSMIFNDFIDLLQNNDSTSIETLRNHQSALQDIIEKETTDSLNFCGNGIDIENSLRRFAKTSTLGMLNALCSDLVINRDINTAVTVFSYQFFLTFLKSSIYDHIDTNFNITINKEYGISTHSHNYRIIDTELKRNDAFEPWVKMFSMSVALSEQFINNAQKEYLNKTLSDIRSLNDNIKNYRPQEAKDQIQNIKSQLESYEAATNIKRYATSTQKFLYQCVLRDYIPDYNSFFLNRFNEITPLVPMNPESVSAYEAMSELYASRFSRDIEYVKELRSKMKDMDVALDRSIALQDSLKKQILRITTALK